jgi:hypothetical protein
MAHERTQESDEVENHYESSNQAGCSPTGSLTTPMTGGPLYCRIRAFDGYPGRVRKDLPREDGSERIGSRRRLPIQFFVEETFEGWYARNFTTVGAGDPASWSAGDP